MVTSGGVDDPTFEDKFKDLRKILDQGQGPTFLGQTLSRPRTGMLEAKVKDQRYNSLAMVGKFCNIF